jgi:NAD-dependent deacetylase
MEDSMPLDPTLAAALRSARSLVVLTGSGVSAASGIPTYRGDEPEARWKAYDLDSLSTQAGFDRDPAGVFGWYQQLKTQMDAAQPNAAHRAIAELERHIPTFALFTQNIDSLHQRAGSSLVHEVHGTLARVICSRERSLVAWDASTPPICPRCGAHLRHDVVWFGELLDADILKAARHAFDTSDVALVVGTSSIVAPISMLPDRALRRGKIVVEVNPDAPLRGIATHSLAERADVALPLILEAVASR